MVKVEVVGRITGITISTTRIMKMKMTSRRMVLVQERTTLILRKTREHECDDVNSIIDNIDQNCFKITLVPLNLNTNEICLMFLLLLMIKVKLILP